MTEETFQSLEFDPDGVGVHNGNYFGMPFSVSESRLALLSVPWDVTSSYGSGSSSAPDAIIEASTQLDFYDPYAPDAWRRGIATLPVDYSIQERSMALRDDARKIMEYLERGNSVGDSLMVSRRQDKINAASLELNDRVFESASGILSAGVIVGLVGGDHSTPYGLIKALGGYHKGFGILHLDAHCDLREAYEGFQFSHASIMFNVLRDVPAVEKVVQVGVRDYSNAERELARKHPKITQYTEEQLAELRFGGALWSRVADKIVSELPEEVYISFDIDFLSPELCPGTGTPVPGGASFAEAVYLLRRVADSGRRIIGFDLCEVAPVPDNPWDANVGARILFRLCGQALRQV